MSSIKLSILKGNRFVVSNMANTLSLLHFYINIHAYKYPSSLIECDGKQVLVQFERKYYELVTSKYTVTNIVC